MFIDKEQLVYLIKEYIDRMQKAQKASADSEYSYFAGVIHGLETVLIYVDLVKSKE